jgi:hypothetical protein
VILLHRTFPNLGWEPNYGWLDRPMKERNGIAVCRHGPRGVRLNIAKGSAGQSLLKICSPQKSLFKEFFAEKD